MKVQQIFFKNNLRNFSYLITFDDGAIYSIDPFNGQEVLSFLKDAQLTAIINTHDHCDHYSGTAELVEKYHCPVMGHERASVPSKSLGLKHGDLIHACGEWTLEVVDTPGHTFSHICLLLKKAGKAHALFTGDCLFNAGVGNCHDGDVRLMYQTIHHLFSIFPDELLIYPGHEYLKKNLEFTLSLETHNSEAKSFLNKVASIDLDKVFFINDMALERKINSFLRLRQPEMISALGLKDADDETIFIKLRDLRNKW